MIFDHAVGDKERPLVAERREGYRRSIVHLQHSLLLVCSSLRNSLMPYFYSHCKFYLEIDPRLTESKSAGDIYVLRTFRQRGICRLDTLRLTIKFSTREYYERSHFLKILFGITLLLFEDYRASKDSTGGLPKNSKPDWQWDFLWRLWPHDIRTKFFDDFQRLVAVLGERAFEAATHQTTGWSSMLHIQEWLHTSEDEDDCTYRVRKLLRGLDARWGRYQVERLINECYGSGATVW